MNPKDLLLDKRFKDYHFNNITSLDSVTSTGSLEMDLFLNGGLRPGVFRVSGPYESGKTAFALTCAAFFQKAAKKNFALYVNAEGRNTPLQMRRAGIDESQEKWFQLDCNVADVIYEFLRESIMNNDEGRRYFIILDSTDAMQRLGDVDKGFGESEKVAGGALINSTMGKRMSLPLTKNGHTMMILSQERVDISTASAYTGPTIKPSGGKALDHYSSFMATISKRYNKDYIWENDKGKTAAERGKPIGHLCTFRFEKTAIEKSKQEVVIPIRYGYLGGQSIWTEYEIYRLGLVWKFLKEATPYIQFSSEILKELKAAKIPCDKEQIKGERNFINYLGEHPKITQFLKDKFLTLIKALEK